MTGSLILDRDWLTAPVADRPSAKDSISATVFTFFMHGPCGPLRTDPILGSPNCTRKSPRYWFPSIEDSDSITPPLPNLRTPDRTTLRFNKSSAQALSAATPG